MPVIGDACHGVVMAGRQKAEERRAITRTMENARMYAKSGSGPGREAECNEEEMKRSPRERGSAQQQSRVRHTRSEGRGRERVVAERGYELGIE